MQCYSFAKFSDFQRKDWLFFWGRQKRVGRGNKAGRGTPALYLNMRGSAIDYAAFFSKKFFGLYRQSDAGKIRCGKSRQVLKKDQRSFFFTEGALSKCRALHSFDSRRLRKIMHAAIRKPAPYMAESPAIHLYFRFNPAV